MAHFGSRRALLMGGAAFAAGELLVNQNAAANETPSGTPTPTPGVTVADLEQQLKSGLKARRTVEFDFIRAVTLKVKNGQLPIDLVQSTYLWARRHQPYPYPYFERAMRDRAAKAGYSL